MDVLLDVEMARLRKTDAEVSRRKMRALGTVVCTFVVNMQAGR